MSAESLFTEGIEFSSIDIRLELTIPALGVKGSVSLAECGQLIWRKLFDLLFNRFDFKRKTGTFRITERCQVLLSRRTPFR